MHRTSVTQGCVVLEWLLERLNRCSGWLLMSGEIMTVSHCLLKSSVGSWGLWPNVCTFVMLSVLPFIEEPEVLLLHLAVSLQ